MNEPPGFIPDLPPQPDPGQPPHVITECEILYLSLDLQPGPYGSIPHAVPEDGGDPG